MKYSSVVCIMPGKFICKVIPFTKLLRVFLVSPFLPPSITHLFYYTSFLLHIFSSLLRYYIKITWQLITEWKHRMVWVGSNLKDHLVPITLPWAGTPMVLLVLLVYLVWCASIFCFSLRNQCMKRLLLLPFWECCWPIQTSSIAIVTFSVLVSFDCCHGTMFSVLIQVKLLLTVVA